MKTKYINYIKEDLEMKKLVMMVMVMVIMSMATGCAHEVKTVETKSEETEYRVNEAKLYSAIYEEINEFVTANEGIYFDDKEIDISMWDDHARVLVDFIYEGRVNWTLSFSIDGSEFLEK